MGDIEPLVAHRKLVERVEAATSKLAELRTARAKATEADQQAEQAFAAGKRVKLLPPTAPSRRRGYPRPLSPNAATELPRGRSNERS